MYNTYDHDGLKRTDYESFCNALKISWIKTWENEKCARNSFLSKIVYKPMGNKKCAR